jgi:hypothetical protein
VDIDIANIYNCFRLYVHVNERGLLMKKIVSFLVGICAAVAVSTAALAVNSSSSADSAVKAPSFVQNQSEIKGMSSPDVKSLIGEASKSSAPTSASIEKLQGSDMQVAQYTPRSTGCSTGCSVGCSVGCR